MLLSELISVQNVAHVYEEITERKDRGRSKGEIVLRFFRAQSEPSVRTSPVGWALYLIVILFISSSQIESYNWTLTRCCLLSLSERDESWGLLRLPVGV